MRKLLLLCICSIVSVSSVFGMNLSLQDATDKIIAESNDIKKSEANIHKAKAQLNAINAQRWPSIDGSVGYINLVNVKDPSNPNGAELPSEIGAILSKYIQQKITIPDNIFSTSISITQPIYTFGKIGNAVDAIHDAIEISKSTKDLTMREVKYAAANLYWTAKMTDGIVRASKTDLNNARVAKTKLTSAGRANRSNLIKIESDIATKEIHVLDAEFNRDTAYRMLKIMAGIDVNENIVLIDEFPDKFSELNVKELKNNPEWDIYTKQINMYESNASSKRAGAYPTLAATGNYSFYGMGNDYRHMFEKEGSQSAYWGVALQVPIFSGGLHSANATMEAMNAEAARQDLDKSKKLKTEEYNTAIRKYKYLCDNLAKLNKAYSLAQKTYDISAKRFANGQTSAVELSEVSSALYQMDIALLSAKYNILMSSESIKKLGE